jgi:predicted KAP-like P-loop ATPase
MLLDYSYTLWELFITPRNQINIIYAGRSVIKYLYIIYVSAKRIIQEKMTIIKIISNHTTLYFSFFYLFNFILQYELFHMKRNLSKVYSTLTTTHQCLY